MHPVWILLTLLAFPSLCFASIQPHRLLSDGAVLQRQTPIKLDGTVVDENQIQLFLDDTLLGKASIKDNRFSVTLPAQPAGGPHVLRLVGSEEVSIEDVYFGDVWLASGQSNMELTMSRVEEAYPQDIASADFPLIREFTVPDVYDFHGPRSDYDGGQWLTATQQNVRQLSAVAYYFARQIQSDEQVPIGILNASLGGSPVEAWMSESALKSFPEALKEGQRFADDQLIASIQQSDQARQQDWYERLAKADPGLKQLPWYEPQLDDSDWPTITMPAWLPDSPEQGYAGVWWLRKTVTLDKAPVEPAILRMGTIVDADEVYVNGTLVGNTTYQYPPRRYVVAPGILRAGKNQITVRVTSNSGITGFYTDKPYFLETANQTQTLDGEWKYQLGAQIENLAPQTFIRWKPMGLYNAMIAPALDFPIKGALWYQGESNTGAPQDYDQKLITMIKDWRQRWRSGDFPFLIVQLTSFMDPQQAPQDSNWALLRDKQQAVTQLANTANIVTLDVGEWNDIHPVNKKTVGERLALAAEHLAYHKDTDYQGPTPVEVSADMGVVTIQFDDSSPLVLNRNDHNGFALAGEDGEYFWAKLSQQGQSVYLSNPNVKDPKWVRYGWADNPIAGLSDQSGLPAAPFQMEVP